MGVVIHHQGGLSPLSRAFSLMASLRPRAQWVQARETLLRIVPDVSILLTGESEAELLTGISNAEDAAHELQQRGPAIVAVKLGARGALAVAEGDVTYAPGFPVQSAEPVGAGDAFNAGFLSARLRGGDIEAALRLGNAMGALATTTAGDTEGLPDRETVETFMSGTGSVKR